MIGEATGAVVAATGTAATWLPRLFAGAERTDKQPAAPHPLD
jgi:hypothetical protein